MRRQKRQKTRKNVEAAESALFLIFPFVIRGSGAFEKAFFCRIVDTSMVIQIQYLL
jgi:hypothetical protein